MISKFSAKIETINAQTYEHLKDKNDTTLVLLFEKWCSHSQKAQDIFEFLDKDQRFKDLDINLAYFDLKKHEEFRKMNNIKTIPTIHLIMHNVEITYNGNYSQQEILTWVLEKTQLSKIPKIEDLDQFKKIITKNVFLYNGDQSSPRFKLFAEGFYHYPDQQFFYTDDPYIEQEFNLEENVIYFFEGGKINKYKRAYKKDRYLDWVLLQLKSKYTEFNENTINGLYSKRTPTLIMVYDNSDQSKQSLDFLKENYDMYYEDFKAKLCNIQNKYCKEFLNKYKDDITQFPSLILMKFHKKLQDPIFYEIQDATPNNIEDFLNKVKQNKVKQKIFSESTEPLPQGYNESVRKISRNSLSYYFADNKDRDSVILFYSSESPQYNEVQKQFAEFSNMIYQNDENKQKISLAHFDMHRNSCEVLKPINQNLFLRIYRHGVYSRFYDKEINQEELKNFQRVLLNFLTDMTTERVELYDFNDDIQFNFKQFEFNLLWETKY